MNRNLKAKIFEKFGTQYDFLRALDVHELHVSRFVQGRRITNRSRAPRMGRPPGDRQHGTLGKGCFQ